MQTGTPVSHTDEIRTLHRLLAEWRNYSAAHPELPARTGYVEMQFFDTLMRRRMEVLEHISPHIRGRVLEWGCHHALDSCIHRMRHGDALELYGCDIVPDCTYQTFYDFAGLHYTALRHPTLLPYEDSTFDVVTSTGVLEHVPDDAGSIREVFRVLKPGGTFVITLLPNRYSYTESLQRRLGNASHERLYSMAQAHRMLAAAGFQVTSSRYFLMVPTVLNGFPARVRHAYQRFNNAVWAINGALERLWPLNRLASNLTLIAVKPQGLCPPVETGG